MKEDHKTGADGPVLQTTAGGEGEIGAVYGEHLEALRNATIMMIDDEPLTLDVIEAFLSEAGYRRFIPVTDSTRAMDLIHQHHPDVVLLDLNMPAVDGFEILGRMRNDRELRHTPLLVLTSSNDAETKLRCLELGATDFLAKPVDSSELALRVRNTLAAKSYQDRLTYYDALTGLPNRKLFLERLRSAVRRSYDTRQICAVLHVDLDRFQQVNDSLGLLAADGLLKEVGSRLVECVRASDPRGRPDEEKLRADVCRLGGDEFSILLTGVTNVEVAGTIAQRILSAIGEPFQIGDEQVYVTPSIGIAAFPPDGDDPEALLQAANTALSHAKQQGRNNYQFISADLNARSAERLSLKRELRKAIGRDEFVLWYQPKVDVVTGGIAGVEALMRWNHPGRGLVPPDRFIPLAEETGLILPMGEWVIREACIQHERWRAAGLGSVRIAVNVSGQQFADPNFLQLVSMILENSTLESVPLSLELTESVVMRNVQESIASLHQMRELGVKVSIDDFGTGYSSLSYLKRLPIDELKIDRSFVRDIDTDDNDRAIVAAVVALARSLGLRVVAEGVETDGNLAFLRGLGCDEYQGYLYSKPLPADDFAALLAWSRQSVRNPKVPKPGDPEGAIRR